MPTEHLTFDSFEQLYNRDYAIGEDQDLRRLAGKYDRYYYDEANKSVIKDVLILQANRKVLLRSVTGIYRGFASYCINAILSIHLFIQNDQQANSEQLSAPIVFDVRYRQPAAGSVWGFSASWHAGVFARRD